MDVLTGLANRREFECDLEAAIEAAGRGTPYVLGYLDLDRFHEINRAGGHRFGDKVLRDVATLVQGAVRQGDLVARVGGDEFAILMERCSLYQGREVACEIVRAVSRHCVSYNDKSHAMGVSIGLVEINGARYSLIDLMRAAESSSVLAKTADDHVHAFSARDMTDACQRDQAELLRLQSALAENRLYFEVQPVDGRVSSQSGRHDKRVELRLLDQSGESVATDEFVRAASRFPLMSHIDRWVVQTAFTLVARGAIPLEQESCLRIDLATQTLADASFPAFAFEQLGRSGCDPRNVCFVIEDVAPNARCENAVRQLRDKGFQICWSGRP